MTGYWNNAGAPPTKVTWANPTIVPEGQRASGGWYYNPNSGYVERWWASGSGPGQASSGGGGSSSVSTNRPTTAEDIMRRSAEERARKYGEQTAIWKEFMSNPTWFDEALARRMSEDKFNRYYNTLLEEFVAPIQMKTEQSLANEQRLLAELVRKGDVGAKDITMSNEAEMQKAREGFAGSGLHGSGVARRSLALTGISGTRKLSDFMATNKASQEDVSATQSQMRDLLGQQAAQREKEYFGEGREYATAVTQDVEKQRLEAQKTQGLRALEAIRSRSGEPIIDVPNYLR